MEILPFFILLRKQEGFYWLNADLRSGGTQGHFIVYFLMLMSNMPNMHRHLYYFNSLCRGRLKIASVVLIPQSGFTLQYSHSYTCALAQLWNYYIICRGK